MKIGAGGIPDGLNQQGNIGETGQSIDTRKSKCMLRVILQFSSGGMKVAKAISVDLLTKVLNDDHNVFFARPGKGYRLYDLVVRESTILVDLPALDLDTSLPFAQQPKINQRIHRSRALKKWYAEPGTPEPSRDLANYSSGLEDAGTGQVKGILAGFFERAKQGDLVIVAPRSYVNKVYIGEITTPPGTYAKIGKTRFYGDDDVYGRSVQWLASTEKRWLPQDIIEIIHKPNAFVQLPKSSRRMFYDLAYESYQVGNDFRGRFDVSSAEFTAFDDLIIQSFFNFIAVNTKLVSESHTKLCPITETNFIDAGLFGPDLQTEVSSPGFLSLSAKRVTPIVAAALFALAVSVPPADAIAAAEAGTLKIGNSNAPPDDPCVALVQQLSINQLKLHGLDQWPEACEKAIEVQKRTGLKGPARVKP